MPSRYQSLSADEADDLVVGIIGLIVADAMNEVRAMTETEWNERNAAHLPHYVASAIFYAVQNRLAVLS
jgi:hypothetical protein